MRLGVISDSHGDLDKARIALREMSPVDLILHAGDHYNDALVLASEGFGAVEGILGNCDFSDGPREKILVLAGKKILLTHGHQYNVKTGYQRITYRAQEAGVDAVIFGHTHVSEILAVDGLLLFNPGTVARPRFQGEYTYGLIEIKNGDFFPHIFELKGI